MEPTLQRLALDGKNPLSEASTLPIFWAANMNAGIPQAGRNFTIKEPPATTYLPEQLPVKYCRRWRA